jgi:NAD(P)-dependent dehydrogenase (short-subunit alcohol dehydrogenase family)
VSREGAGATVLVIGAAGTIGAATCRVLAERGTTIWASDHREPRSAVGPLEGGPHHFATVDVTDPKSVTDLVDEVWEAPSQLAGVVYAAGTNYTGYVATTSWPDYDRVMDVNLRGAFHVGQALAARLHAEPRPLSTVWLSSVAGLVGEAGGSVYVASKFGLLGFVQSLASEIARDGGRANAVCPGNVDSPMLVELAERVGAREGTPADSLLRDWARSNAFGRLIDPAEVARTCAWLVSEESSGISGQTIVVDGPVPTGEREL